MKYLTYLKPWIFCVFFGIVGFFALGIPHVHAGTLTDFSYSADTYAAGQTATYTFRYTTETTVTANNRIIYVGFPSGYDASGVEAGDVTITVDGSPVVIDDFLAWSSRLVLIGITTEVAGGSDVVVTMGDVINHATPGTYSFLHLYTSTGGGGVIDAPVSIDQVVVVPLDATPPSISTLSPADDSTGASRSSDLVIEFDEAVNTEAGADNNISIYRSSDDSLIESIDAQDSSVTGDGTTTITIDLTSDFPFLIQYYVQIGADAFDDTAGNSFAGISDSTTWNFTSVGGSNVIQPIATPSAQLNFSVANDCQTGWSGTLSFTSAYNADEYRYSLSDNAEDFSDWHLIDESVGISLNEMTDQYLYTQLRNSAGVVQNNAGEEIIYLDTSACDITELEEDDLGDEDDLIDVEQETGPSPVDGTIELITSVAPGMYIKAPSYSTVYYLSEDMIRHPFMNEQSYFTYQDDFEEIVSVTDATLATLLLGRPMSPKAGTVLVKIVSLNSVYFLEMDESGDAVKLRLITSEGIAIKLFGENWSDYVIDVSPALFSYFDKGEDVNDTNGFYLNVDNMRARDSLKAIN